MKKNSFILYTNYSKHLKFLTREQKGLLLEALFEYVDNDELLELDPLTLMAFSFIKEDIDINANKWVETKERRAEAGRLGGLAKASNAKQTLANLAVNENGNVNENVISTTTTTAQEEILPLEEVDPFADYKPQDLAERVWITEKQMVSLDCLIGSRKKVNEIIEEVSSAIGTDGEKKYKPFSAYAPDAHFIWVQKFYDTAKKSNSGAHSRPIKSSKPDPTKKFDFSLLKGDK